MVCLKQWSTATIPQNNHRRAFKCTDYLHENLQKKSLFTNSVAHKHYGLLPPLLFNLNSKQTYK